MRLSVGRADPARGAVLVHRVRSGFKRDVFETAGLQPVSVVQAERLGAELWPEP